MNASLEGMSARSKRIELLIIALETIVLPLQQDRINYYTHYSVICQVPDVGIEPTMRYREGFTVPCPTLEHIRLNG